ncbi:Phosphoacetylglucosamine mutase [Oopsacas minuta]|uniref:Phosphoacetylglucosamine mutase n=1 Tax=Oopsacas minuta TaxID=111878 RepID=A0AAV7KGN8_9METZ|nr:Phosphoacetylglucosamine mutase [Oopsacas minuta]
MASSEVEPAKTILLTSVANTIERFPLREGSFSYGTAGFRTLWERLPSVVNRMGILAALRSRAKGGQGVGAVVTASHNPIFDNGVKLVDPDGGMLSPAWEGYATRLANASQYDVLLTVSDIIEREHIDLSTVGKVFIARDTRPSGEILVDGLLEGAKAVGAHVEDLGVLTTPQLHYAVRYSNLNSKSSSLQGYMENIVTAFRKLVELNPKGSDVKIDPIKVDCANGVGAIHLKHLAEMLSPLAEYRIYNDGTEGVLNEGCGAEHVKSLQVYPIGLDAAPNEHCCSLDGDADRIMFFYNNGETSGHAEGDGFKLLDGDRMASLLAGFIHNFVLEAELDKELSMTVIQTAYANGNSTSYLTGQLKLQVMCTSTGVKYLHAKALEHDIGVYFEANGHGTVLFSDKALQLILAGVESNPDPDSSKKARSFHILLQLSDLLNQAVGDAFSDMLAVQIALLYRGWSYIDWINCYSDLPNRLAKVRVRDRSIVKTTDAERRCVSPPGLQDVIDRMVKEVSKGRAFVRPSGTEDIVRVYAEAETNKLVDELSNGVIAAVFEIAGGVDGKQTHKSSK